MPAHRSRTENWRSCLEQIQQRGGAIELAVRPVAADPSHTPSDLVFRVKLLHVGPHELLIAPPNAAGQNLPLAEHLPVMASYVIGQNRWAFRTTILGKRNGPAHSGEPCAIALSVPAGVDRCPRRSHERVNTVGFNLPLVRCWPILDPASIAAAEAANRGDISRAWTAPAGSAAMTDPSLMPEVGPCVNARLMNLSGGGVGLLVDSSSAGGLDRHAFTWVQLNLMPHIPAPLCVTVRRVHTHLESSQMVYLGCGLDFTWSPQGQKFVGDLLARYIACLQGKAGEHKAA